MAYLTRLEDSHLPKRTKLDVVIMERNSRNRDDDIKKVVLIHGRLNLSIFTVVIRMSYVMLMVSRRI